MPSKLGGNVLGALSSLIIFAAANPLAGAGGLAPSHPSLASQVRRDAGAASPNVILNPAPPARLTLKARGSGLLYNDQIINANGGNFWIGKYTSTYCPQVHIDNLICPPGYQTVIQIGVGGASMYSDVPAGQVVYVHNETGALSFTPAHASGLPVYQHDAVTSFSYDSSTGKVDFTGLDDKGWLACPVTQSSNGTYQIFADVESVQKDGKDKTCVSTEIIGTTYGGSVPAWQYE